MNYGRDIPGPGV